MDYEHSTKSNLFVRNKVTKSTASLTNKDGFKKIRFSTDLSRSIIHGKVHESCCRTCKEASKLRQFSVSLGLLNPALDCLSFPNIVNS